jgi:NTP pyrophosphatase (non-canonical NTP hydrolase)
MGYLTNGLSFNTLRRANMARLPLFKNAHGEPAHAELDGSDWTRSDWLEAATGELGEYANFSKKFRRGDITEEEFLAAARKELADVVTYLDILASQLGINLGEAIRDKFNEVSTRVGADVFIGRDDDWHTTPRGNAEHHSV